MTVDVIQGDCLDVLPYLPDGSIDSIVTDPPYGTTACKWDSIIPLGPLWDQLKRVIKPDGVVVMTASQPFTTTLISSNMRMFKYCWVWEKSRFSNQMLAKKQPLKTHEDICVFYRKAPVYNPQGLVKVDKTTKQGTRITDNTGGDTRAKTYKQTHSNYPKTVLKFKSAGNTVHPTQKPVALMEYLIRTYTDGNETVLDFSCGSGTTGVACVNTNRNGILIEKESEYVEIARNRIKEAIK